MTSYNPLHRVYAWWRHRFGAPGRQRTSEEMTAWFETPLGRSLWQEEGERLDQCLQDRFGFHLLQMSVAPALDVSRGSRIAHRVTVSEWAEPGRKAGQTDLSTLVADHCQLPLPAESVDLVVLHHLLDYSQAPHQLLREAERVLIPRGWLVIVGFNPWSGFGLVRALARPFSRHSLWHHRALRLGRLLDWLQLLDLAPDRVERGFYRPPLASPGVQRRLRWLDRWGRKMRLPGGAFYVVLACKEVGGAVALKPEWESSKGPLPGFGAQPMRHKYSTKTES